MAFLVAGISALLWLLLIPVRALAYVVAALLARARSLMLSLFNLTLELQDKPPVGSVKGPVQNLQTTSGGPASSEKKAGEETSSERISSEEGADSDRQFANDGSEERGPSDNGLEISDRDKTGSGEANRDETGRDGTDRDETSHDSTAASGGKNTSLEDTFSLNEKSITGRVFQP